MKKKIKKNHKNHIQAQGVPNKSLIETKLLPACSTQMEATIRLFKALEVKNKTKKKPSKELLEKTLKRGFIFSPEVIANYTNYDELIKIVEKEVGLTPEELNNSFHKSWKKVKEASDEQLFIEQIIHYFTTYGYEELGIYDESFVYVPKEKLDLPELKGNIKLVVIKGYTKKELKEKLFNLVGSGVALKEETIKDIIEVSNITGLSDKDIEDIKNKEVKIRLYDLLNKIPYSPQEFLRYLIYKLTSQSLLIKNDKIIKEIKESEKLESSYKLLTEYKKKYGLEKLSEVFYRYKPLFLALRGYEKNKKVINKIRKLAKKNHKPIKEDYLNLITAEIKKGKIDKKKLNEALDRANIFRKIRLAYALNYRTKENESILYKIRNGKGYATNFEFKNKTLAKSILKVVLDSIAKGIHKNIKGKKIYLPEFINYTLPATEKQFTGDLPSGTSVIIPNDMVVGVHWEDVKHNRIDLDLSLMDKDQKFGWDANYRSGNRDVLFSGDLTYAPSPKGATELFYLKKQATRPLLMSVNYFNYDEKIDVPFKIIVAKEEVKDFKSGYMVNPNNIITLAKSKINKKQLILGLLVPTTKGTKFYFSETYLGDKISSFNTEFMGHARKYLFDFYENAIDLKEILGKAGAKFVKDKKKCNIDLSPEVLEKDTILNLLK